MANRQIVILSPKLATRDATELLDNALSLTRGQKRALGRAPVDREVTAEAAGRTVSALLSSGRGWLSSWRTASAEGQLGDAAWSRPVFYAYIATLGADVIPGVDFDELLRPWRTVMGPTARA